MDDNNKLVRTVIPKMRVEDCREHEGLMQQLIDALLIGLDAHDAVLGE